MRSLLGSAILSFEGMQSRKAVFTRRHVATTSCNCFQLIPLKKLVTEDLIQNAHTLFDGPPPPSSPVPSPHVGETTSTLTYGSPLSPEFSRLAEAQAVSSTTRHRSGLVGGIPTSTRSSFSSSHSDSPVEGRLTPTLTPLLRPLLGLSLSQTLKEGAETTTQEQVIPGARGTHAVETLPNSSPPEVVSLPPTSVADWWLPQPGLHQHPEAPTIPQSRPESALSYTSDFSLCSASLPSSTTGSPPSPTASLQSEMGTFSPAVSERF